MKIKVNDNLLEGESIYVGIDYHQTSWKVTIIGEEHEHKKMSENQRTEILVNYLNGNVTGESTEQFTRLDVVDLNIVVRSMNSVLNVL